jgi:DNA-binding NarL/FixJ family response regulator
LSLRDFATGAYTEHMVDALEAGPEEDENTSLANQVLMESDVLPGSAPRIRVMICDGHEAVRRALRVRLSVPKHLEIIGVCSEPVEAADLICTARPDIVVLGLHRSSDSEMARVVQFVHDMSRSTINVVVLAPYVDAVEREILLDAGAKRYLLKHINSDQLIREIENVVAGTPGDN